MSSDQDYKDSIAATKRETARVRHARENLDKELDEIRLRIRAKAHAGELLELVMRFVTLDKNWDHLQFMQAADDGRELIAKCEGSGE